MRFLKSILSYLFQHWYFVLLAVLIIVAAVDSQIIWFQTVGFWDDNTNVFKNPFYAPLTWQSIGAFWSGPYMELYLPVTYTCWAALVVLSRFFSGISISYGSIDPMPFYIANLLVHLGVVTLIFLIFRKILPSFFKNHFAENKQPSEQRILLASAAGALFFGLHPVQVESVAWISCLRDLLGAFFSLSALFVFLLWIEEKKTEGKRSFLFLSATVCFLIALGSKPGSVVLPVIVLLCWLAIESKPWRSMEKMYPLMIWFFMSFLFVVITSRVQVSASLARELSPFWARPLIATDAIAFYITKIFYPTNLCPDYGRSPNLVLAQGWLYWTWLLPFVLGLILFVWKKARIFLFPYALLIIGLLPMLGLVPFNFQVVSTVSDRYLYLAMIGPALAFALLVGMFRSVKLACLFVGVVLIFFIWGSLEQLPTWSNTENFCKETLALNPRSWKTQHNYAHLLDQQGKKEEAIEHFKTAVSLRPQSAEARNDFGLVYLSKGWAGQAVELFQESFQLRPTVEAANNLALAYLSLHEPKRAIAVLEEGEKIAQPTSYLKHQLAWIFATYPDPSIRNGKEALRLAQGLLIATEGKVPMYFITLAAAEAEIGDFPKAIAAAEHAKLLFEKAGNQFEVQKIETFYLPSLQHGEAFLQESKIQSGSFSF